MGGFPLGAEIGREDVDKWISSVATDLVAKGSKRALLFICGPVELVRAAQRASTSSERAAGIAWQLHVEQFQFLPTSRAEKLSQPWVPCCGTCKGCGRNIQCLIQVHSPLFFQMSQCRHNIRPQMIKFSIWSHNGKHKCMQLKLHRHR